MVPPHPHLLPAAVLLLLLSTLDVFYTTLYIGTFCTSVEGADECALTMMLVPFAGVVAPVYGLMATLLVWRGFGNDVVKFLKLDQFELIDPRLLADTSPGAALRMLRRGSLWNAASLVNASVALACTMPDWRGSLFTSGWPWLLPVCLIFNKLLLAQAYHLLAAATGLVEGAHTLLVNLMGWGDVAGKGAASAHSPNAVRPTSAASTAGTDTGLLGAVNEVSTSALRSAQLGNELSPSWNSTPGSMKSERFTVQRQRSLQKISLLEGLGGTSCSSERL
mmetsp:Transcript_26736/g.68003  ORF Transcript_26736/g.68003 Transcript_26736/m.68003 type:complete len:278 (+) Transcript_26736:1-834(+)